MLSTAFISINGGIAALAIEAVQSVLKFGLDDVTIHLLENASSGDDANFSTRAESDYERGSKAILHFEAQNHRFGRGNNIVLQKLVAQDAPPDSVLLLNSDGTLENDVISLMGAFLDTHHDAGMVGADISKLLRRWQVTLPPDHPAGRVDWFAGAAVMRRLKALRDVSFFDPVFFFTSRKSI
jgi:GT2 family glycosyltransferase